MTWVELKLFLREPLTVVFVFALPLVVLFVLNGIFGDQVDPDAWQGSAPVDFYTSAYVVLVAATAGVLSLPVHLSGYRERGVVRRFRASGVGIGAMLGAHVVVTVVMATVGGLLLAALSHAVHGARLPENWLGVIASFFYSAGTFAVLGLLLGYLVPTARASQGVGILLFFVFMMLGGAGPPQEILPTSLSNVAGALPVTTAGELVRNPWRGDGWSADAFLHVSVWLAAGLGLLAWRVRHDRA